MIVLFTATIDPKGCLNVERSDVDIRIKDYYNNIKRFLEETDVEIVFVENSGADLKELSEFLDNDRVEILQFEGNDYPRYLGKGYGEMSIINHAIKNSKKLSTVDYIIKITGRYYFDYNKVKDELKKRSYVIYKKESDIGGSYVCTGFYKVPKHFWINEFSDKRISDEHASSYMETTFALALLPHLGDIYQLDMELEGISGTNNRPMVNGLHT